MSIGVIFKLAGEFLEVRVVGNEVFFRNSQTGKDFARMDSIHLDKESTFKEYPDLRNNPDWRTIALQREKEELAKHDTEEKKMNYIIQELRKKGYKPIVRQREGHRPEKVLDG